jgi:hypothetical protein
MPGLLRRISIQKFSRNHVTRPEQLKEIIFGSTAGNPELVSAEALFRYWEIGWPRSHHIKSKSTATIKRVTSPNCFGSNFFLRLLFLVRRLLPATRDRAGSKCYCLMLLGNASQKALELHL